MKSHVRRIAPVPRATLVGEMHLEMLAGCRGGTCVDAGREVEEAQPIERDDFVARALEGVQGAVGKRVAGRAPADDEYELVVVVGRLLRHAADRLREDVD